MEKYSYLPSLLTTIAASALLSLILFVIGWWKYDKQTCSSYYLLPFFFSLTFFNTTTKYIGLRWKVSQYAQYMPSGFIYEIISFTYIAIIYFGLLALLVKPWVLAYKKQYTDKQAILKQKKD